MNFARSLALAVVLAAGLTDGAAAQNSLEIIGLRHRTAEQVLPALRPLMEPGATLTGHGTELIVRTSPANLAELRRALETLDRPLRRLSVLVRFDDAQEASDRGVEASARITNRGAGIDVRTRGRDMSAAERVDQRLRVLEGGRAYIFTGQSTPVFDGSGMRETATGFDIIPRVAGNTAIVELAQRRDTPHEQQGLLTTVSAPLGQWFEVGGALEQASRADRGIAMRSAGQSVQSRRVWLKIEEVGP